MPTSLMGFDRSLFNELREAERQLESMFGRWAWPSSIRSVSAGTYPPVNVGTTPEQVDVYVFAAGLDPKKLDISIQQNVLTISGARAAPEAQEATYYRRERYVGEFRRVLGLPEDVDPERVDASYTDGVLHISVKRREAARPRQIEIR